LNRIDVGSLLEETVDLKLTGKIALVTGSTAGIGLAIARSLATEGAHVYVNGRTQERVDAAVAMIRSQAAAMNVNGIVADFSSAAGAQAMIAKLPAVDVLINNVGIRSKCYKVKGRLTQVNANGRNLHVDDPP
jgi:NAD(P)-dependent dehydrogenase (short-subunit alcohol dehydrogenase family)